MKEHRGKLTAKGRRIGVVASRFNGQITEKLVQGAYEAFLQLGGAEDDFEVFWVPGALEIPQVLQALARQKRFDGLLALGCVIRGETPHFDHVAREVMHGVSRLGHHGPPVPATSGVILAETMDQAIDRAGGKMGNRGRDALLALLEVIGLLEELQGTGNTA